MRNIQHRESKVYLHLARFLKRKKKNENARENKVSRDNKFTRSRLVGYDITARDETTRHATSKTRAALQFLYANYCPPQRRSASFARSKVITVFPPNIATRS